MASTNKSLSRFQLREISKGAKSSAVENKALAVLFVLILVNQLRFLSTVMKDGVMDGIDAVATPSFALIQFCLGIRSKSTLLNCSIWKVIVDIFAIENGRWFV